MVIATTDEIRGTGIVRVYADGSRHKEQEVTVQRKDGTTQTVRVGQVSQPFRGKYGAYEGKECVIIVPAKHGSPDGRCIACMYEEAEDRDEFDLAVQLEREYRGRVDRHTCGAANW